MLKTRVSFHHPNTVKLLIGLLISIVSVDFLTTVNPVFGTVGSVLWMLAFIPFVLLSLKTVGEIWAEVKAGNLFWLPFTLITFLLLTGYHLTRPQNISGETTQEIECALTQFTQTQDRGFHNTCLFNYPTRQYYVPMLPSLITRSQLTLNLGGTFYIALGILVFAGGLLTRWRNHERKDLLTALPLVGLLHLQYFNHFLFSQYEQSIYPISFTLMGLGILIHYWELKKPVYLVLLGLCMQFLLFAYTPSLAVAGLGFLVFIELFRASSQKHEKKLILGLTLLSFISLVLSLTLRNDIHLFGNATQSVTNVREETQKTLSHFVLQNQGSPSHTALIQFPLIMTLGLLLIGFFGKKAIVVGGWVVATLLLASLAQGYSFYNLDFRVHRSLVIYPVLFFFLAQLLTIIKPDKKILTLIFVILYSTGIFYHGQYMAAKPIDERLPFQDWLKANLPDTSNSKLFFVEKANLYLGHLNDQFVYFVPNLTLEQTAVELDSFCTPEKTGFYVMETNHPCYLLLETAPNPQWIKLAAESFIIQEQELQLFSYEAKSE